MENETLDPLLAELESAKQTAADNLNLAKYHKAELENFRKRNAEAVGNAYRDGRESVVLQVLPLMDALYDAMKPQPTGATEGDREGIRILINKFASTLASLGIEEMEVLGKPFNPHHHDAVCVGEVAGVPPDTVVEVWQRGYTMNGKVIRPATVKVSQ